MSQKVVQLSDYWTTERKEKTLRELYEKIKMDMRLGVHFYDGKTCQPLTHPGTVLECFTFPGLGERGLFIETPLPPEGCPKMIRIELGECSEERRARQGSEKNGRKKMK